MPLRPGRCYRKVSGPAYTRKDYAHANPPHKVAVFETGNKSGQFSLELDLIALEEGNVRSNALESARMASHKYLVSAIGENNFHLKVRAYPHHIYRENKMLATAGADRLQDGMRLSFGKPTGTAARVWKDGVIITIRLDKRNVEAGKEALRRASLKIPLPCRVKAREVEGLEVFSDG